MFGDDLTDSGIAPLITNLATMMAKMKDMMERLTQQDAAKKVTNDRRCRSRAWNNEKVTFSNKQLYGSEADQATNQQIIVL